MKKYIIFCYDFYYPCGGLKDIFKQEDSLASAIKLAERERYDFKEIVDRDTWEIVWEN